MSTTGHPASMGDLLAVATVRRLLLELGFVAQPETGAGLIGPLGVWILQPREDLGGLSPLEALNTPTGEADLKACLSVMVSPIHPADPRKE